MTKPDPDELRERYTRLIRQKGMTSSQTEITARKLGIDVDGLLAERKRDESAGKGIEIHLDLATLAYDSDGMLSADGFFPWKSKVIPSLTVIVDLPGLGIYGTIPPDGCGEVTVAEVLIASVRLILAKFQATPDQFRHTLPWGIRDIELERLVFNDSSKTWTLFGGRMASALERTIRALHPSHSIDIARRRAKTGERIHAEPWPELAGDLVKDAESWGVEAILCDYSKPRPATDPRASIRSGSEGPAPLPSGTSWPVCPNCGGSPSFWESIDFRDTPFSHLLPGTSLSLFVCDYCLDAGEWSTCATPIWLPADRDVELVSKGNHSPILAARQWTSRERSRDDIPAALSEQIETEWPKELPCGFSFVAPGTKAGGHPYFLQADSILFGSDGCLMEYIGQFTPPEACWFGGAGYIFHSTTTGETVAELQSA